MFSSLTVVQHKGDKSDVGNGEDLNITWRGEIRRGSGMVPSHRNLITKSHDFSMTIYAVLHV